MVPLAVCVNDLIDFDDQWPHHLGSPKSEYRTPFGSTRCAITFLFKGGY